MKTLSIHPAIRAVRVGLTGSLLICSSIARAQQLEPVTLAPPLSVDVWFNVKPDERPSLEALRGRPVLVEFWGTSVKNCSKTIPHAQSFHDRYADLGLRVLVVSYDTPAVLERLIEARGYGIPIGADGAMASFHAYGIPEVPTACLIGPDGGILYFGAPEAADLAIESALGIEASPSALLDAYIAAEEDARVTFLERLITKSPRCFDLAAWAALHTPEGAAVPEQEEPLDPAAVLSRYARESRSSAEESAAGLLVVMAEHAPRDFDLLRWSRSELARRQPLTLAELEELLAGKRYEAVLDGLLFRNAEKEPLRRAAEDAGFVQYCAHVTLESRTLARKALLAQHWVFAGVEPLSRQRLWTDLGVSGSPLEDAASAGFSVGTERVDARTIGPFIDEQVLRFLATSSYASRRVPDPARLRTQVAAERKRLLRDLIARHGGVHPEEP